MTVQPELTRASLLFPAFPAACSATCQTSRVLRIPLSESSQSDKSAPFQRTNKLCFILFPDTCHFCCHPDFPCRPATRSRWSTDSRLSCAAARRVHPSSVDGCWCSQRSDFCLPTAMDRLLATATLLLNAAALSSLVISCRPLSTVCSPTLTTTVVARQHHHVSSPPPDLGASTVLQHLQLHRIPLCRVSKLA